MNTVVDKKNVPAPVTMTLFGGKDILSPPRPVTPINLQKRANCVSKKNFIVGKRST